MFKKFYLVFVFYIVFISFINASFQNTQSKTSNTFMYPTTTNQISSYFGYRELFGKQNFHNGIDFPASKGSPVFASLSGTITFTGFSNGYGNSIIILHDNNYKTLYAHLDENLTKKISTSVKKGEIIGYVGPIILSNGLLNGWTTGPHLHFSIFNDKGIAVDPLSFNLKLN